MGIIKDRFKEKADKVAVEIKELLKEHGDKKIGEGEVVTINDFYGLQIKSILSSRETLESLL